MFEKVFRKRKRKSWRVDETYVKVKGQWKYLYRAVDKAGNTVDFLLRAHRDKTAARRYFEKAIEQNGEPETITVDKSGANLAALEALNAERLTPIKVRQNKYLNNVVEQDHRAIKRIIKPMMGFKDFRCARIILSGIEIAHVIRNLASNFPRHKIKLEWSRDENMPTMRLRWKTPATDRSTSLWSQVGARNSRQHMTRRSSI